MICDVWGGSAYMNNNSLDATKVGKDNSVKKYPWKTRLDLPFPRLAT